MTETPYKIPEAIGKLKTFKSLEAFFDFFKEIEPSNLKINEGRQTYKELYDRVIQQVSNIIEGKESVKPEYWYGKPLPLSYQDALSRERYQLMNEYNQLYLSVIKPRLEEIIKNSKAELELPTLKYNDLGLGIFDFNKASTGLIPKYQYYSFKKKDIVEGNEVVTVEVGGKFKYKLIADGSPVVLVPHILNADKKTLDKAFKEIYDGEDVFVVLKKYNLKIGGQGAFGSVIKKVYVQKEKVLKPKNAVRVFVKLGQNNNVSAEQYKWSGYAAIGIAELLSIMGYAVNIIGVYGYVDQMNINQDGNLSRAYRFWGINLKSFEETLDAKSILYVCSDATFFRIKIFDCIVKQASYFNDYMDMGLGSSAYIPTIEQMVFSEFGKRDKFFKPNGEVNEKSEFLYYVIGDLYSEQDVNEEILNIGLDIVNKNKLAREKLLGI